MVQMYYFVPTGGIVVLKHLSPHHSHKWLVQRHYIVLETCPFVGNDFLWGCADILFISVPSLRRHVRSALS